MKTLSRGFTLIELMVSLVVIGVGIGALIYLQSRLTLDLAYTVAHREAVSLAISKLTALRTAIISPATNEYDSIESGSESETVNGVDYTKTWIVTEFTQPSYKVIDLSVSWTNKDHSQDTIKLATAVAKVNKAAGFI